MEKELQQWVITVGLLALQNGGKVIITKETLAAFDGQQISVERTTTDEGDAVFTASAEPT